MEFNLETLALSKSGVGTYEQCSYRFMKQWIEGDKGEDMEQLTSGKMYHNLIEELFTKLKVSIGEIESADALEKFLRSIAPKEINGKLDVFISFMRGLFDSLDDKRNIIPVLSETYMEDEELQYFGTVDAVFRDNDGDYIVVDWKSGKYWSWAISKYRFELAGYKHLIEVNKLLNEGKGKIKAWGMLFLDSDYLLFEPINQSSITAFKKKVIRVRQQIKDGRFIKNVGRLCDYCPVRDSCMLEGTIY